MSSFPFKAKAIHEYTSAHEDEDLSFPNGQIITVNSEEDADWYSGEYIDTAGVKQEGIFPKNFVERYEPEAPPRPSRPRPKKDPAPVAAPEPEPEPAAPEPQPVAESIEAADEAPQPPATSKAEPPTVASPPKPTEQNPPAPAPAPTSSAKAAPPPVAEKPSSFKDRIAAFNKASAQPIAPVKPGPPTGSSSTFIKKPFVAPPPSRDAYVPPPSREHVTQKVYRREEDPEIAERQAQDLEDAEKAGLITTEGQEGEDEDSKPTTLRDRIALLQKQQQEQAMRRAEAVQKDKPKRPTKKPVDSSEQMTSPVREEPADVEPAAASESRTRHSEDSVREVPKPPSGRRPSRDPTASSQDIMSDGNEADQSGAGDTTEDAEAEDTEVEEPNEKPKPIAPAPPLRTATSSSLQSPSKAAATRDVADEPDEDDEEEEEEEEEMDEETRRKLELRERMAKMSGGMGMPGMFGPIPPKKSRASGSGTTVEKDQAPTSPPLPQRAPAVPVPGMTTKAQSPDATRDLEVEKESEPGLSATTERGPEDVHDIEEVETEPPSGAKAATRAVPTIPQERAVPPLPPSGARSPPPPVPGSRPAAPSAPQARPVPPPPPRAAASPGPGSESDDDLPLQQSGAPAPPPRTGTDTSARGVPPPVPKSPRAQPEGPRSPPIPSVPQNSYMGEADAQDVPTTPADKRSSRPPPIPGSVPTMPPNPATESRPPPPPPPTAAPPTRKSTMEEAEMDNEHDDDGESDYEGDYDTDIAPSATHKNALKAHAREPSLDESTLSEAAEPAASPATRGVPPPPPPHQAPVDSRQSVDAPRAPPPAPPPHEPTIAQDDGEYDPYRYTNTNPGVVLPTHHKARVPNLAAQEGDPAFSGGSPQRADRAPPPPPQSPPQAHAAPPPAPPRQSREMARPSMEPQRTSTQVNRKSTDLQRASTDQGQMAQEIDLSEDNLWWASPNVPPPVIQGRPDVLCEFEESSNSKRGGRTTISKDVYILYQDYSQTVVTARFDSKNPSDVSLEQRHEPPPSRLRQDQLETAHAKYGQAISAAASAKQNQVVGNGSANALVFELVQAQPGALLPIGTRAYGALVYANMANATVQQVDEIRPGDIITFRNAKFSGKHGAMHAKYSEDVGKPDHVGIVVEWDGTKKKVRALEQGRENKKVKIESFRVGDLRSGEVKVWRVMGRDWVGWDSS